MSFAYSDGTAAGSGADGRGVVVGAVSALRAKQPYDFTFDPHSELSVEKLKDWIDQFLSGKLKKVVTSCLFEAALLCPAQLTHRCTASHPVDRPSAGATIARRVAELPHFADR